MADEEKKARELEKEQRDAVVDIEPEPKVIEDEEDRDQAGFNRYHSNDRDAIVAKARNNRKAQIKADVAALDPEGQELTRRMEAEVRGEDYEEGGSTHVQPPETPAPAAEQAPEPVDSGAELVTIVTDGVESQVPVSDVIEAGKATLQKERNADEKMRRAATYEKSVRDLETAVRAEAENLRSRLDAAQAAPADEQTPPANADAVRESAKEIASKIAGSIFEGDQEAVTERLEEYFTSVVQGRQSSTPPPVDADEFARQVVQRVTREADQRESERAAEQQREIAQRVNTTFQTEFSELYGDDRSFALTKAEFNLLREKEPGADPVVLMRRAAQSVTDLLNPSVESELEARRRAKREAGPETPVSTQRQPAPPPPQRKTGHDIVEEMKARRGQR